MKKYIKPELMESNISVNTSIADGGLSGWLTEVDATYAETITTFQYNS